MSKINCSVKSCVNCDFRSNECLLNIINITNCNSVNSSKENTMCSSFVER